MITFQIREASEGNHIATVAGVEYKGSDPIRVAARALVSAGAADQPWQMRRGERVDMHGASLFALAFTAVSETDTGIRTMLWARHPRAPADPVLDQLLAEFSAEWKRRRAERRSA